MQPIFIVVFGRMCFYHCVDYIDDGCLILLRQSQQLVKKFIHTVINTYVWRDGKQKPVLALMYGGNVRSKATEC